METAMTQQNHPIHLTIDGKAITVPAGSTVLHAAQQAGITIPTLCYLEGCKASTSCMVCAVRIEGYPSLIPSCGMMAQQGMVVSSDTPEVRNARKTALELLLSEHAGDCEGPCSVGCPAGMDIPKMIRAIRDGKLKEAIEIIKNDIALPAILGRICPAPCEKVCRRSQHDAAVSICLLKRYAADADLASPQPYRPACRLSTGKQVAIIGAGPAGLSAAYYLTRLGHACTVFDKNPLPGGMLRYGVKKNILNEDIVDKEIKQILSLGINFKPNTEVNAAILDTLSKQYDAVFLAVGNQDKAGLKSFNLEMTDKGVKIDNEKFTTSRSGIFAGGEAAGRRRLAVRAAGDGKQAAFAIDQYLAGQPITGEPKFFNSKLGKVLSQEWPQLLQTASSISRIVPQDGFSPQQATQEAARCLDCDCAKKETCLLRHCAGWHNAAQSAYKGLRKKLLRTSNNKGLVFEPGKCIMCGLCIQTAQKAGDYVGLCFQKRGFETSVAVPLGKSIDEALESSAADCVKNCPTGALSFCRSI